MARRIIGDTNRPDTVTGINGDPVGTVANAGGSNPSTEPEFATVNLDGIAEPGIHGNNTSDGGTTRVKRKYNRRNTSGTGTPIGSSARSAAVDLSGVEKILVSLHGHVAAFTKIIEFRLSSEEAHDLVTCAASVAEQYDARIDPKTAAWINLGTTVCTVYGMRIAAYKIRKSMGEKLVLTTHGPRDIPTYEPAKNVRPVENAPKPNGAPFEPAIMRFDDKANISPSMLDDTPPFDPDGR